MLGCLVFRGLNESSRGQKPLVHLLIHMPLTTVCREACPTDQRVCGTFRIHLMTGRSRKFVLDRTEPRLTRMFSYRPQTRALQVSLRTGHVSELRPRGSEREREHTIAVSQSQAATHTPSSLAERGHFAAFIRLALARPQGSSPHGACHRERTAAQAWVTWEATSYIQPGAAGTRTDDRS